MKYLLKTIPEPGITILILILLLVLSLCLPGYPFTEINTVSASSLEIEDVLKGIGAAVVIITASQFILERFTEDETEEKSEHPQKIYNNKKTYPQPHDEHKSIDTVKEKEEIISLISEESSRNEIENNIQKMGLSEKDLNRLAHIVYGEARGEPFQGQIAVAAVILNRKNAPAFPDNISDIIYAVEQFTAVEDGQYFMEPDRTAFKAVTRALSGEDPSKGAHYFYNPRTADNLDWFQTLEVTAEIGNHIFAIEP